MTREILLTLLVTLAALGLFAWGRIRVDVIGLMVMTALILLGLVTPEEGVQGFSNEATVTVALMLVLSTGLLRTGAIDVLGRWAARVAGDSEFRLLLVVVAMVMPISAFISNTATVAVLIPVVLGLARDLGCAPSRFLMPLSYAGQLGGTLTLIGTSTNLLVAGLAFDLGLGRIGLFEITPPALVMAAVGVLYLLSVGRWLTPKRESARDFLDSYELRDYLTGVIVGAESPLVGKTLAEVRFEETHGLHVFSIERGGERLDSPDGQTRLQARDLLLVHGRTPEIARVTEEEHLEISGAPVELGFGGDAGLRLAEIVIPPRSRVIGSTVPELNLRRRHEVTVLAIQRHGAPLHQPIGSVRLAAGDVLLVAGTPERLQELHARRAFALLGPVDLPARRTWKIPIAVPILGAVVLLAALEVLPIMVAALLGVIAMVLTRSLTPQEAYEEMDWMVIILLGSILALGVAMQKTGTAEFLARGLLEVTRPLGPFGVLAALYLLTSLLTEIISNNAAAAVLTPIALETARAIDVSPMPLVVAVMFAASNSFMTPIGYQTNTFILGPGGYRFSDYVRVGGPLNLILAAVATLAIPFFFPF